MLIRKGMFRKNLVTRKMLGQQVNLASVPRYAYRLRTYPPILDSLCVSKIFSFE